VEATGDPDIDSFLASLAEPDDPNPEPSVTPLQPPSTTAAPRRNNVPSLSYKEVIPGQASYEAAPVRNVPAQEEVEEVGEPEETEAERREREAREEREEIMGRLEEEERAQEDADSRVAMLKQRMDMIKKRKEARAGGGGAKVGKTKAANGV